VKEGEVEQTNENPGSFFIGFLVIGIFAAGVIFVGWMFVETPNIGCSTSHLEIDSQCYTFTQIEDSFYDTWSTLEKENPEGIGLDLLVSETRLESKDQVLRMIWYLQDEGRATCFSKTLLVKECLPVNTTGTEGDAE
jgi:hypothetical protein